ncbi:hypothetical protein TS71_09190 [Mycolicibacterium neoaurum]|uniref:Uncharacterized protein n=3 Tax=Mycobacteriaceae TaxID=1762 RepID=V5XJP3_MYCNE|nr:hypothetical protein D174_09775 [Mycolicibacterium neoaurum VKM Ac-1815D]AMO05394.1 hypothetical protein MyAD_09580 [Mycolicibacterium neoaurum]AXK76290.1 hypothetical protein DXK33_15465 [Mycolicibacterium neoaurum]KJQ50762.1 hypothetical protein TS71_09190 [Mycolicibacterium neoaurum]KUM09952.1 hypothetical protein AVZ31_03710 [Mycolicibacterium neoaurum]
MADQTAAVIDERICDPMKDKHHQRFPLKYGELRDMRCGAVTDEANGIRRVRDFRPTYFTADWTDGVLVQVTVWGPQLLDDGSDGERDLDYRWKATRDLGPVKYRELPRVVAERLMAYNAENGFTVLPEQR